MQQTHVAIAWQLCGQLTLTATSAASPTGPTPAESHFARYHAMTTPDYKSIALRLYGYGKFAEDYGYREEYWSQLRAIGAELGVADIENPEDLGIPWPPT